MENEVLRQLEARKSVRVFTDEPVTAEERSAIVHAAFMAPTAGNQQLYTILDITDPALRGRRRRMSLPWRNRGRLLCERNRRRAACSAVIGGMQDDASGPGR